MPELVPGNLVIGIDVDDVGKLTTGDLLISSCSITPQCQEGSTCRPMTYLEQNGYVTQVQKEDLFNKVDRTWYDKFWSYVKRGYYQQFIKDLEKSKSSNPLISCSIFSIRLK